MKTSGYVFTAAICIGLLSGCASSYHAGGLDDVSSFPKVRQKKSAHVILAYSSKLNGEPWEMNQANNKVFMEETLFQALENSGMYSGFTDRKQEAEINLLVAVINEKEKSSSNAIWSTLTLFLYPNTETDTFKLMAKVQDTTTGKSKTIQLEDGIVRRQQLLLGLLAPFKSHGKELEKCTTRLMENLALEIHKTGMVK